MAKDGIFYGATGNGWIKPRIEWSARENIEGNYSDVTATLSYTRTNNGYTTYGYWGGSLTIQEDTKQASGIYLSITEHGYTAAITHTVRVYHTDDGSKTITISATGSIPKTTLSSTSISAQVKLEDIPRAASITATDAVIGGVSVVTVDKRSELYTHTVAYQFGDLRGYLTGDGISQSPVQLSRTSLQFAVPESFYDQIPNATAGVCTLTCTTYRDETQVGQVRQTQITLRADPEKCAPLLTARAVDINPETLALTGDEGWAVRYSSHMNCTMSCQSRFGASIVEKKIADIQLQEDALLLQNINTESIRFWVRDSRGYTSQLILQPAWIPYHLPTGKLTVTRTDATSGNADLQVQGNWYCGNFGAQNNSLQLRYRVNGGSWNSLTAEVDGDGYTASVRLTDLEYTHAHKISLEVSDRIHTLELNSQVNPGIPVFDWGQQDFRFHVPVTASRITGLSAPAEETDAVNKAYADTKLSLAGGTMTGDLNMGAHRLTGLQIPVNDSDAASKNYADSKLGFILLWENKSPTSTFPGQSITIEALPNFTHVAIEAAAVSGTGKLLPVNIIRKHTNFNIGGVVCGENGYISREITNVSANVITFGSAYHGPYEDNNWVIPVKVYGVRGVLQ